MTRIPYLQGLDSFHEWKSSMRDALLLSNSWDVVHEGGSQEQSDNQKKEEPKKPEILSDSAEFHNMRLERHEQGTKAQGLICYTVDTYFKEELDEEGCDTAAKMWTYFKVTFSTNNDVHQSKLRAVLAELYMFEGTDPRAHLSKFLDLCARFRAVEIPLANDGEKVTTFLRTLPADYKHFKWQWQYEPVKYWARLLKTFNEDTAEEEATRSREQKATAPLTNRDPPTVKFNPQHKPKARCACKENVSRSCCRS